MAKARKKKLFWVIGLLIFGLAGFLYIFFGQRQEATPALTCRDYYYEFQTVFKTAKLELAYPPAAGASFDFSGLYAAWEEFFQAQKLEQCQFLDRSRQTDKHLYIINEQLRQAKEAELEKKPEAAAEFFLAAGKELSALKKDNALFEADDIFLDLYPDLEDVRLAKDKAGASASLENLKLKYTQLKQYAVNQDYQDRLADLEEQIAVLDRSFYGPDFVLAQERLAEYFLELYFNY